jgi:hypothetical protein
LSPKFNDSSFESLPIVAGTSEIALCDASNERRFSICPICGERAVSSLRERFKPRKALKSSMARGIAGRPLPDNEMLFAVLARVRIDSGKDVSARLLSGTSWPGLTLANTSTATSRRSFGRLLPLIQLSASR